MISSKHLAKHKTNVDIHDGCDSNPGQQDWEADSLLTQPSLRFHFAYIHILRTSPFKIIWEWHYKFIQFFAAVYRTLKNNENSTLNAVALQKVNIPCIWTLFWIAKYTINISMCISGPTMCKPWRFWVIHLRTKREHLRKVFSVRCLVSIITKRQMASMDFSQIESLSYSTNCIVIYW